MTEGTSAGISRNMSVFIVDDDIYYNELLAATLEKIGSEEGVSFDITQLHNAQDCLEKIEKQPDLVLLDFYLDVNNDITSTGYDVLTRIKSEYPEIKILIISAQHEWEQFKDDFKEFGAEDFLKKDASLAKNLKSFLREKAVV